MPEIYAPHPDFGFTRDFKGYGEKGLEGLKWPNNAKIAVSFVINYEEVSVSNNVLHFRIEANQMGQLGRRALRTVW